MLLITSLLSSAAITIGRLGFHEPAWATSSRYVTITALGIAALYLLLHIERNTEDARRLAVTTMGPYSLATMLTTLVIVGIALAVPWSFTEGKATRDARLKLKYVMQTFTLQTDEVFESRRAAAAIRQHAPWLQAHGWSVFHDPMAVLVLPVLENGVPVGEILPDKPVVQQVRCPVERLTDLQILFATYGRRNSSKVNVRLSEGQHTLFERTVPATEIVDNEWWTAAVTPPVESCAGRNLTLAISSPDSKPGNAVTIWSYPRYYQGALEKPQRPFGGRVLGLSLNMAAEMKLKKG
jgi:hypothetical protein